MTHSLNIERGFYKVLGQSYSADQVKTIRKIVRREVDLTDSELFPKTAKWIKSCYNTPTVIEQSMSAIDEVLDNHGVEGFKTSKGDYVEYSNTGDSYALTVVYYRNKFRACSWGDIAEKDH